MSALQPTTTLVNSSNQQQKRTKKKKIVIRPYEKPPQVPPDFYETNTKLVLESTLSILYNKTSCDLQSAHGRVLDLVAHKMGTRLYQDLVPSLREAARLVLPASTAPSNLLDYVPTQYSQYIDYLSVVRHVCLPLDRQYLFDGTQGVLRTTTASTTNLLSLWQVGLQVFSERLQELDLDQRLYDAWWQELWNDYTNTPTATNPALAHTMCVWHELSLKNTVLLHKLQPQLVQRLQQESLQWQATPAFLEHVYKKWNHVKQWTFLPRAWVRSLLEQHLLAPHVPDLLDKLTLESMDHIQRLWTLCNDKVVADAILATAKANGLEILAGDAKLAIPKLLQLYEIMANLQKQLGTTLQLRNVWTTLMDDSAEALAKYMDLALKSTKSTPQLQPLFFLFCHVSAKDVFETFYKKDLAKRLLGKRSNMDLERQFVSLLKSECGAGYTSKMEGMFQDIEWSREQMGRYTPPNNGSVEVDVQVLTTGYWPYYPKYQLQLPENLLNLQEHFETYYKKTYQGRRISWQYHLGQCTLKGRFGNKVYDFITSLSLTLTLLCFNSESAKWTLAELSEQVGLQGHRSEMERILKTLSLGKIRLLKKWDHDAQPGSKPRPDVHDKDWFTLNEEFSSPLKRIRITSIASQAAAVEDREKTMEAVSRDRLYLLDAVLVRIMKARKSMLHSALVPLVLEHAKVPSSPTDVKARIETLIEREYLERDAKDRNRYNYLA